MHESQIKIWWLAARPKTLPAAAAPVIIGTAMAYAVGGFHLLSAIAALFGALFIQIGTNLANDYFDFKKGSDRDDRLGPIRVTQAGLVSPKAVKNATIIAFGLAFLVGIYLVMRAGFPIVVIGLSSILFGVLYTGGKYPIGYLGLGELFVLIYFGPVAVGGTYFVQTLTFTNTVLLAGIAPGLYSSAILIVNNLRDIESDKISGKKTIAVRFGADFSKLQFALLITVSGLLPILLFLTSQNLYHLIPTLILIPSIFVIKNVYTKTGKELNNVLAQTGKLLFVYSLMFALGWML